MRASMISTNSLVASQNRSKFVTSHQKLLSLDTCYAVKNTRTGYTQIT